jgi:hypothetical protein
MDVANIANRVKNERLQNGGELNPQQRTTIENLLNQSLAIKSNTAMGVGTAVSAGANPLGLNWQPGPDGAQDPDALKKKLKAQERRALAAREAGQHAGHRTATATVRKREWSTRSVTQKKKIQARERTARERPQQLWRELALGMFDGLIQNTATKFLRSTTE